MHIPAASRWCLAQYPRPPTAPPASTGWVEGYQFESQLEFGSLLPNSNWN